MSVQHRKLERTMKYTVHYLPWNGILEEFRNKTEKYGMCRLLWMSTVRSVIGFQANLPRRENSRCHKLRLCFLTDWGPTRSVGYLNISIQAVESYERESQERER